MKKERIGIFGGTFNPIHNGHMKAALDVQRIFSLDKVLIIPSHIPPHKATPDVAPPSDRLRMVELAVAPYLKFIPSPIEINSKGKSYSILTLNKLRQQFPEAWMFFILGIDAFLEIETWRDHRKVLDHCHFVVISRPGYVLDDAEKLLDRKYRRRMIHVSDTADLNDNDTVLNQYKIFLLSIDALDIASRDIRKRVRAGKPIDGFVADSVKEYIHQNRLYQRGK